MGLAPGGPRSGRKLPQAQVGGTLIAAAVVVLAIGLAWMNTGGDSTDDVGAVAQRAAASEDGRPAEIPPSQPAVPVSFGRSGEIIRPAPDKARIVDPDTGNDVVIPLPPGATVVDGQVVSAGGGSTSTTRPGTTGSTAPGDGSTGTTSGRSPVTQPPTTEPPTTEPPTTQPPTTEPPTTEPPTTEPPTTEPPAGSTGQVDGLLGGVLELLT
jgi:hypothetical protein